MNFLTDTALWIIHTKVVVLIECLANPLFDMQKLDPSIDVFKIISLFMERNAIYYNNPI